MNELLKAVEQFNANHAHTNTFASFEYSGHTQGVYVSVRQSDSKYIDTDDVKSFYTQHCYLKGEHGNLKNIEELTNHFLQWVNEFEKDQAA